MKHISLIALFFGFCLLAFGQQKTKLLAAKPVVASFASAPAGISGTWMYGNFSTTEYWSKSPNTYLGNAFSMAIAFVFKPDGTYEQYFTSQATNISGATYHQSFTKGKYTVDEANKTIVAKPLTSHYKRTRGSITEEDRDMRADELSKTGAYTYTTGTEPNGTQALYLTIKGTKSTITLLQKKF